MGGLVLTGEHQTGHRPFLRAEYRPGWQ